MRATLAPVARSDVLVDLGRWSRAMGFVVGLLVVAIGVPLSLWTRRGCSPCRIGASSGPVTASGDDRVPPTVAWFRVHDVLWEESVMEPSPSSPTERPGIASLRSNRSFDQYEEVRRRATIVAERWGHFRFGPDGCIVADPCGRSQGSGSFRLDLFAPTSPASASPGGDPWTVSSGGRRTGRVGHASGATEGPGERGG